MTKVVIIDYGMGNLHSIAKALQKVASPDTRIQVSRDTASLRSADKVVFPGVGAIRDCMQALTDRDLKNAIMQASLTKPMLGICLGMQALMDFSEENEGIECLGRIPGVVRHFGDPLLDAQGNRLKVPHMGWNRVHFTKPDHPLWLGIENGSWFYFVHSYHVVPALPSHTAAVSHYPEPFTASLQDGTLFAVQFHPEKSQAAGLKLLANFLAWAPD